MRLPLALAGTTLLLGCVADDVPVATSSPDADLFIELDDIRFSPERVEIPGGETVTVELVNVGGISHDLVFEDGWDSGEVAPGASTVVTLPALDGDTVGWCSVPGHRDAGMELEIVVKDPTS